MKKLTAALIAISLTAAMYGCGNVSSADESTEKEKETTAVSSEAEEATVTETETNSEDDTDASTEAETESDAETEPPADNTADDAINAYKDYMNGIGAAVVERDFPQTKLDELGFDYNELDWLTEESYDIYSLEEKVMSGDPEAETTVKYSFIDLGGEGVPEMLLRFESSNTSMMNWTGIFHYNGSELELNYAYADGYRTYSAFYDSGHLNIGGSNGAASSSDMVVRFDESGHGTRLFLLDHCFSASIEAVEYALGEQTNWEDEHAIPYESALEAKYLITADGDVKMCVIGGWSDDTPIRAEEEDYISYVEGLGAEMITPEEMDALTNDPSYFGNEIEWSLAENQ